jgi:hypothetical protein
MAFHGDRLRGTVRWETWCGSVVELLPDKKDKKIRKVVVAYKNPGNKLLESPHDLFTS